MNHARPSHGRPVAQYLAQARRQEFSRERRRIDLLFSQERNFCKIITAAPARPDRTNLFETIQ
jgi:hypothetical protein